MHTKFPIGSSLKLIDFEDDLHPAMHQLRTTEPISWIPCLDAWLVTSYKLCTQIMRDAKTFTVDHPGFSTAQVVGQSMLSKDGQAHQHHRQPFEQPFRKKAVEARFETETAQYIKSLIQTLKPQGQAELRRDYAAPIAVQTMITALGLDEAPVRKVLTWYDAIVNAVTQISAGKALSTDGKEAFQALKANLLPSLKKDASSSLLAAAGGSAQNLNDDEIISNAAVLLFGGIETTEGMIANAFYHLLSHPYILEAVRSSPDLIPQVIEESLRLEPAASVVDRYATKDIQLADVQVKEGDLVRVSLAAANRDPHIFETPDTFKLDRTNLRSHVTFAQGPHVCLGLHLARLEAQLALNYALQAFSNLQFQSDSASRELAKPKGLIFRKPEALYCQWNTLK